MSQASSHSAHTFLLQPSWSRRQLSEMMSSGTAGKWLFSEQRGAVSQSWGSIRGESAGEDGYEGTGLQRRAPGWFRQVSPLEMYCSERPAGICHSNDTSPPALCLQCSVCSFLCLSSLLNLFFSTLSVCSLDVFHFYYRWCVLSVKLLAASVDATSHTHAVLCVGNGLL